MMCFGAFFMGNSLNSVKEYSLLPPLTFNLYEIDPAPAPVAIVYVLVSNRAILACFGAFLACFGVLWY